jgi:hypothetical protein
MSVIAPPIITPRLGQPPPSADGTPFVSEGGMETNFTGRNFLAQSNFHMDVELLTLLLAPNGLS